MAMNSVTIRNQFYHHRHFNDHRTFSSVLATVAAKVTSHETIVESIERYLVVLCSINYIPSIPLFF